MPRAARAAALGARGAGDGDVDVLVRDLQGLTLQESAVAPSALLAHAPLLRATTLHLGQVLRALLRRRLAGACAAWVAAARLAAEAQAPSTAPPSEQEDAAEEVAPVQEQAASPPRRGRGRPRKVVPPDGEAPAPLARKGRGRPRVHPALPPVDDSWVRESPPYSYDDRSPLGPTSFVDCQCMLKIWSWNIFKASRDWHSIKSSGLARVLLEGFHEVVALQEVCKDTATHIQYIAARAGFDYFAAAEEELLDSPAKRMRNVLLVRRGALRALDSDRQGPPERRAWGAGPWHYAPVTVVGSYGRAGHVRMGITCLHTQGGSSARVVTAELAETLHRAQALAEDPCNDLDLMVVIGDANLQLVDSLHPSSEVDVILDAKVRVQTPHTHQDELEASDRRPAAQLPEGAHWWPTVAAEGPWVFLQPHAASCICGGKAKNGAASGAGTLSSGKLADGAFVWRRRPVNMLGPSAIWVWPYQAREEGAASKSFGSEGFTSDHRPVEVTFIFGKC